MLDTGTLAGVLAASTRNPGAPVLVSIRSRRTRWSPSSCPSSPTISTRCG
jgi:hypothetical protein